jgi:toxin ParE1/3/4
VKIRWFASAIRDLKALRQFIEEDDASAAAEVAKRIIAAVEILADFPSAGRPGRIPSTRELLISGTPYLVAYRVVSGKVEVLRVLHGARKWPERL